MFNPRKSYRHPALRVYALACIVYDASAILAAKIKIFREKKFIPHRKYTLFNIYSHETDELIDTIAFGVVSYVKPYSYG